MCLISFLNCSCKRCFNAVAGDLLYILLWIQRRTTILLITEFEPLCRCLVPAILDEDIQQCFTGLSTLLPLPVDFYAHIQLSGRCLWGTHPSEHGRQVLHLLRFCCDTLAAPLKGRGSVEFKNMHSIIYLLICM